MGITIAVLLTLAMLGSVLWVMPSPREKMQTVMRGLALQNGVKVRLLDESTARSMFPWIENHRGYVVYDLPLPAGKKWSLAKPVVQPVDEEKLHELDRISSGRQALSALNVFEDLPENSEAVILYAGGLSVVWREQGGEESAQQLIDVLRRCKELTDRELLGDKGGSLALK